MPKGKYKDPNYMLNYRLTHREQILKTQENWRKNNKEHSHNYYETNKTKILNRSNEHIKDVNFSVIAMYSNFETEKLVQPICACCGETELDFLTIDHINNDGAEQRRKIGNNVLGGWALSLWIIKNNFPDDLQVLCGNCQLGKRRNNGVCTHKINHMINEHDVS
jgi:hypothetical protein